ncbi:MAG: hypothetical protein KIG36_03095 [Eubacteriales bacterium]|nr:hypothetical protein [Eubacteriales bacterium]
MFYGINKKTGAMDYLTDAAEGANFIASPVENPMIEDEGSDGYLKGFGSLYLTLGSEAGTVWDDYVVPSRVEEDGWEAEGKGFRVVMRVVPLRDKIRLSYTLTNEGETGFTVRRASFDSVSNNNYTEFHFNQRELFDTHTLEHVFPCGENGWEVIERLSGMGPLLYIIPENGTRFEHVCHTPVTLKRSRPGICNHSFYGTQSVFFCAGGYLRDRQLPASLTGVEPTERALAPGEKTVFTLEIGLAADRTEFERYLVQSGRIVLHAAPAYIVEKDEPLIITAASETPVVCDGVTGESFTFTFEELGEKTLRFTNGMGFVCLAKVLVIDRIGKLIRDRAAFVMNKQVYHAEGDLLDGAIVPYCRKPFGGHQPPLCVREGSLWGTGSYEGGLCEIEFVSLKNLLDPSAEEIAALDDYIDGYLFRYLQDPDTHEICWFFKGGYTFRSYNYIHLANFWLNMYRLAVTYGLTRKEPGFYLTQTCETLRCMFRVSRAMDVTVGNMNEQVIPECLEALKRESHAVGKPPALDLSVYFELEREYERMIDILFKGVPYAAECAYDNTGYESIIRIAEHAGRTDVIRELENVMRTVKGFQSVWWWNGSEYRWWDAETDFAMNCHHYTSPGNAGGLLDEIIKGNVKYNKALLEIVYGGLLGAPAKIDAEGFCSMSYCCEPESPLFGFHPATGDSGLSNFNFLKNNTALAVGDDAYLCRKNVGDYEMDGRAVRRFACAEAIGAPFACVETEAGTLSCVKVDGGRIVSFEINAPAAGHYTVALRTLANIRRVVCDQKPIRLGIEDRGVTRFCFHAEEKGKVHFSVTYRNQ